MSYDRPTHSFLYIDAHTGPEALYFITVSALSRRNLLVAFGLPLLGMCVHN